MNRLTQKYEAFETFPDRCGIYAKGDKIQIWADVKSAPQEDLFAVMNTVKSEKTIVTCQRPHSGYIHGGHKEIDKLRWDYFKKAAKK